MRGKYSTAKFNVYCSAIIEVVQQQKNDSNVLTAFTFRATLSAPYIRKTKRSEAKRRIIEERVKIMKRRHQHEEESLEKQKVFQ
jgi:hypothetical protein